MTPAVKAAKAARIPFETLAYQPRTTAASWGEGAAEALGVDPTQVFKTLVIKDDTNRLTVAVLAVDSTLDLKALASHFGAKSALMATATEAQRATGYVTGGISPLGLRRRLPILLDRRALSFSKIYISAGKRGLELALDPRHLLEVCGGEVADLCRSRA